MAAEALLAHDRAGPRGGEPLLLLHAGVADRRMWDPVWAGLTAAHDVVRVDLRGYGESSVRPTGPLDPVADVVAVLRDLGVNRCHVVGASYGAGVAVELALTAPDLVASLVLSAPGGSLIAEATDQLRTFFGAERSALAAGDLDAAVEANLVTWVDGPSRGPLEVDAAVRGAVRVMQRRAFEVTADWDDLDEAELDPPALERLTEVRVPTTVLVGGLDVDAIGDAGRRVVHGTPGAAAVPGARLVEWADVAHLPSMERPDDFVALVGQHLPHLPHLR